MMAKVMIFSDYAMGEGEKLVGYCISCGKLLPLQPIMSDL